MKQLSKKLLSVFLMVCLFVGLFPAMPAVAAPDESAPFTPGEGGAMPSIPVFTANEGEFAGLNVEKSDRETDGLEGYRSVIDFEFPSPDTLGATSFTLQYSSDGGTTWNAFLHDGVNPCITSSASQDNFSINPDADYVYRLLAAGGEIDGDISNEVNASAATQITPTEGDPYNTYFSNWGIDESITLSPTETMAPYVGCGLQASAEVKTRESGDTVSGAIEYQWYRVNPATFEMTEISGATEDTYVTGNDDIGYRMMCRISCDETTASGYLQVLSNTDNIVFPNEAFVSDVTDSGFVLSTKYSMAGFDGSETVLFYDDGEDQVVVPITGVAPVGESNAVFQITADLASLPESVTSLTLHNFAIDSGWQLCYADDLTGDLIPMIPVALGSEGGSPPSVPDTAVFSDSDLDRIYFAADTLTFNLTGLPEALAGNTQVRVAFGLLDQTGSFVNTDIFSAGLTDGSTDGTGYYVSAAIAEAGGTLSADVSGQIKSGLGVAPIAVQIFVDMNGPMAGGWTNALQLASVEPTYFPLIQSDKPALVGFDNVLPSGVTSDPAFADISDFYDSTLDITFTKDLGEGNTGSISFTDLDFTDSDTLQQLDALDTGLAISKFASPEAGTAAQFSLGIDGTDLAFLAGMDADLSLQSPTLFNGMTNSRFTVAGSAYNDDLVFDDVTDTLTFSVAHFSDYTVSLLDSSVITFSVSKTNVTTEGGSDGSITVISPSGGGGTYDYSYDNGETWVSEATKTGLVAGTYQVKVRDAANTTNVSNATQVVIIQPVTPAAPAVTRDDTANTVSGMAVGMEYNLDGAGYVAYSEATFNAIDFSGNHTLLVRVAAEGINPAGAVTTLTFTINPPTLGNEYEIGTGTNIDAAADGSGNVYAVFESSGSIYFAKNREVPEAIAGGGSDGAASIAVEADGTAQVAFVRGTDVMYAFRTPAGDWTVSSIASGNSNSPDIDVDGDGYAHIVYKAGSAQESDIMYANNTSGTFNTTIIFDGEYCNSSGDITTAYYYYPSLKVDSTGSYHISARSYQYSRSWSAGVNYQYYTIYYQKTGVATASAGDFGNDSSVTQSRRSMALQSDLPVIAYSRTAGVYNYPASLLAGSASAPAAATSGARYGVAYVSSGVKYILNAGAGFSAAADIDTLGTNPALAVDGSNSYVYYEKDGKVWLKTDKSVAPPIIVSMTDGDLDNVYFEGDSLSFNIEGLNALEGQPVRVAFGLVGGEGFASAGIISGLTSSADGVSQFKAATVSGGTFSADIAGSILQDVGAGAFAVKIFRESEPGVWTNIMDAYPQPYLMLGDTGMPACAGVVLPAGITSDPVIGAGAQDAEDLYDIDIAFTKLIDADAGISGKIAFTGLDLITSSDQLASFATGITMQEEATPGAGALEKYTLGVDVSTLSMLDGLGAVVSVTSPSFDGLETADFAAAAADGFGAGVVSGLTFNDTTDTVSFTVNHFSNYVLTVIDSNDTNADGYHDGDVAALKAFMDQNSRTDGVKNGGQFDMFYNSGMRIAYFDNSTAEGVKSGITWAGTPKRITAISWACLDGYPKYFAGTLDARSLSELTSLEILNGGSISTFDAITAVQVAGLSKLQTLKIQNVYEQDDVQLTGLSGAIDLTGVTALRTLSLAGCYASFPGIDLTPCTNLIDLNLAGNGIETGTGIVGLDGLSSLTTLDLHHNAFRLSALPLKQSVWTTYDVGMQVFSLDTLVDGNVVDLSEDATIDGAATTFTWVDADTSDAVISGFTNVGGVFTFDPALFDGKTLYCVTENEKFPLDSYDIQSEQAAFNFISLGGTITDGTDPIEGATVELLTSTGASLSPAVTATTDASGNYTFIPVEAGTYDVKISVDGYHSVTINDIVVAGSDVTGVDAGITVPTVVSGTVTAAGDPVSGHTVSLKSGAAVLASTTTNASGEYSFGGGDVINGNLTIAASAGVISEVTYVETTKAITVEGADLTGQTIAMQTLPSVGVPNPNTYSGSTFSWTAVSGAGSYQVYIKQDGTNVRGPITTTNAYLALTSLPGESYQTLPSGTYNIIVKAIAANPAANIDSDWSALSIDGVLTTKNALEQVNDASTAALMKTALETNKAALGISDSITGTAAANEYFDLTSDGKTAACETMLGGRPYADNAAVSAAFAAAVKQGVLFEETAKYETAVTLAFDSERADGANVESLIRRLKTGKTANADVTSSARSLQSVTVNSPDAGGAMLAADATTVTAPKMNWTGNDSASAVIRFTLLFGGETKTFDVTVTIQAVPASTVLSAINAAASASAVQTILDLRGNRNNFGAGAAYVDYWDDQNAATTKDFSAAEKLAVSTAVWNAGSDYSMNSMGKSALISAYEAACKQVFIERAKTIIGSSFAAVEGVHTNILTGINALPGLSATGVSVSLTAKTPADTMPITLPTGTITYNGSAHTGTVTLELLFAARTEEYIIDVTVPQEDTTEPTAGGSGTITTSNITKSSVTLSWTAASDVVTTDATKFVYYVGQSSNANIDTLPNVQANATPLNGAGGTANITSYTVTGLSALTTYYFNIVAKDLAGNLVAYTMVEVTTLANTSGGGGATLPVTETPTVTTTTTSTATTTTTTTTTTVTGTTNTQSGTTTASVPASTVTTMIGSAKSAETTGQKAVVEIKIETTPETKIAAIEIPKDAFNQVANSTDADVRVGTGIGSITFDPKAVETISGAAATGSVSITIAKVDAKTLDAQTQEIIGDRPVYDFTVMAGDSRVSNFGGGSASIGIPYTLKPGEDKNAIVVYFIDDDGNLQTVRGAYDEETGNVNFVTTHFSKYAVGYNKVEFADVSDSDWYFDAVSFIAAREITAGTGNGCFSPDAVLTRGQFIVMLMKAYGIAADENPTDNFADAGNTYYTGYLAAAKRLGISNGVGSNQFAPDSVISREELFTLLYRALDVIGELPEKTADKSLSSYSDANRIADYAKEAINALLEGGIISGSGDTLTPKGTSNRAQMAQVLYNLLSD